MSGESLSSEPELSRALTLPERALLDRLLRAAGPQWQSTMRLKDLRGRPMHDGCMGSLRLVRVDDSPDRRFGKRISEVQFNDVDGVAVIASLNVDHKGELFELDLWKVDFSPVVQLPPPNEP